MTDCVQRWHNFAIVDEVDSILIDEARTPLIISGASEKSTDKNYKVNRIIPTLAKGEEKDTAPGEPKILTGDFVVEEKHRNITVTDEGWEKVEGLPGIGNIADPENWDLKHHVETAVKAHSLYRRDVEYVVKDGEVIIVDEFTGRLMPGRRWSDGLHQAVEAKEGVKIERENQTLATITFQNYFRMYKKLAGMTGTAETEAPEFEKIYRLEVLVIPTNRTLLRKENPDIVYRTEKEKYFAASDEIQKLNQTGQPVLVGTTSIEKSERLSELLKKKGVKHWVLNAKQHEREAEIVAQAGRKAAVTIATNMAGRGTDILLGGNPEFMAKQECVKKGIAQPIRAAQGKIEGPQEDGKTTVWYYAGNEYVVPTDQWNEIFNCYKAQTDKEHEAVYGLRRQLLEGVDQKELILEDYVSGILGDLLEQHCPPKVHPEDWDLKGLKDAIFTRFGVDILAEGIKPETLNRQELGDAIFERLTERYDAKEKLIGPDAMRYHERMIMLSVLDAQWKDHLLGMDHLKEGIGLRGYGQHDPLVEYKRESFDMFEAMMQRFQEETVRYLYLMQILERPSVGPEGQGGPEAGVPVLRSGGGTDGNGRRPPRSIATSVDDLEEAFQRKKRRELEQARMAGSGDLQPVQQVVRGAAKIGRNDPCPCGSGKKYKKCCGANA